MTDEATYTATLKAGGGYHDPWLVIRAEDEDGLIDRLQAVRDKGLAEMLLSAAETLHALKNAQPLVDAGPQPAPQQQQPTNVQQGPWQNQQPVQQTVRLHPEGIKCAACSSPVQWKEFDSKQGNHIKLWVCPNQRRRDDGHYSEWAK